MTRVYDKQFILDLGAGKTSAGLMVKAQNTQLTSHRVALDKDIGRIDPPPQNSSCFTCFSSFLDYFMPPARYTDIKKCMTDYLKGITYNSRVYIIGHSKPGADKITSDNKFGLDPETGARCIKAHAVSVKQYAYSIHQALASSLNAEYKDRPLKISVVACNSGTSKSAFVQNRDQAKALQSENRLINIIWPHAQDTEKYHFLKAEWPGFADDTFIDRSNLINRYKLGEFKDSFAEKLCKELAMLGVVSEVAGRTNKVSRTSSEFVNQIKAGTKPFAKFVAKRHKIPGDKIGFISQGEFKEEVQKVMYNMDSATPSPYSYTLDLNNNLHLHTVCTKHC